MKKEKLYLVMSSSGSWDDYFEYAIFATKNMLLQYQIT